MCRGGGCPCDVSHFSFSPHFQEKRIYDLKKKNQELEKFKFVLDYKIKELKKQIEPKENEIKVMKEQIQEVREGGGSHSCPSGPLSPLTLSFTGPGEMRENVSHSQGSQGFELPKAS